MTDTPQQPATIPSPYRMTVSLNVLNHLGINLYSNIPAVLSELVANAYDADATEVEIILSEDTIVVRDDGVGMTQDELNVRFLQVGYDKRNDKDNPLSKLTPLGRAPMGRKGIGKLSVFSIAKHVEVHSAKDGESNAFSMDLDVIEAVIKREDRQSEIQRDTDANADTEIRGDGVAEHRPDNNHQTDYRPQPLAVCLSSQGTTLVLSRLKKQTNRAAGFLRRRLARRFAIQGEKDGFQIKVDGNPITIEDRDFFKKIQFLWYFGPDADRYAESAVNAVVKRRIDDFTIALEDGQVLGEVSGWVGTVEKPSDIEEQDNVIVLQARKKLIQEDILKQFQEAGVYADYIVGEINADFLDDDGQDDIVTSDRQRIREDDPRYERLKTYLRDKIIGAIRNEWSELRIAEGRKKAEQNPVLSGWLDSQKGDTKKYAERMLARIESFTFSDEASKVELYKASIMGFERLALRNALSRLTQLEQKDQGSFETTMKVLSEVDDLESAHYHQIVKARLDVIRALKQRLPTDKERAIQEYLFDHLWLLDPAWERATAVPPLIEQSVKTAFAGVEAGLTDEQKKGRVDIRYQRIAGTHVIIELKKYDRKVGMMELMTQVEKYITALQACIVATENTLNPSIEAICIVGPLPTDHNDRTIRMMEQQHAKVITYDSMIASAEQAYADYLGSDRKVSRIVDLVDRLTESFQPSVASADTSVPT